MGDKADANQVEAFAAVRAQAQKCSALLEAIAGPNGRILTRAQAGESVSSRIAADRYNSVCAARSGAGSDPWLDEIRGDADLKAVCDNRWELGEAVDALRDRLGRLDTIAAPYDDFERCIREAVTRPDRSPAELAGAVAHALELARAAGSWAPRAAQQGTLFDRWMDYLKNNRVIAAILIAAAVVTGAATLYKSIHDALVPTPSAPEAAAHGEPNGHPEAKKGDAGAPPLREPSRLKGP